MMEEKTLRIDKWLKTARFFKQRQKAAEAVENGRVKLNGERVKPSKPVKIGDELTVKKNSKYLKFIIKDISERSVSADIARELYEASEPYSPEGEISELKKMIEEQEKNIPKNSGSRPTKKERRILNKYKYMTNDQN